MSEQNLGGGFLSRFNFFQNKDAIKFLVLIIGVGCLATYLTKKYNEIRSTVDLMTLKMDEFDEKFDAVMDILDNTAYSKKKTKSLAQQHPPSKRTVASQPKVHIQTQPQISQQTQSIKQLRVNNPQPQPQIQPQPQLQPQMNPLNFLTMFMQPAMDGGVKMGNATEIENEKVDEVIGAELQELNESEIEEAQAQQA